VQSLHRGRDRQCKTNSIDRAPSELVRNAPALTVSAQLQHCSSWNPAAAVSLCHPCEYFFKQSVRSYVEKAKCSLWINSAVIEVLPLQPVALQELCSGHHSEPQP
jgi:hypothetical protein